MRCAHCNKEFDPQGSPPRSQVIWVRYLVRISGSLFRIRGALCTRCNNELRTYQVAELTI